MRPGSAILTALLLAAVRPAAGSEGTNAVTSLTTNQFAARMDLWHAAISGRIVTTVDRVDRFFADDRVLEDTKETTVRAGIGVEWDEAEGAALKTRFNARLALPRIEQRLQLVADNFTETDEPLKSAQVRNSLRESSPDAGIRYIVKDEGPIRFSGDAGLRLGNHPQVFGKLRARLVVPFDPWEMRLTQTAQWYSRDGFGETSEMRWSRLLRQDWIFRSSSRLSWREDRDGVTPAQSLTWQRAVGNSWGHRISLDAEWPEVPSTTEASYVISYGFRRLMHRDWLFMEVIPGVDFAQTRDYEPNPRLAVIFEILFGGRR